MGDCFSAREVGEVGEVPAAGLRGDVGEEG